MRDTVQSKNHEHASQCLPMSGKAWQEVADVLHRILGNRYRLIIITLLAYTLTTVTGFAENGEGDVTQHWGKTFFMFAIVLVIGRMGDIVQRFGQPPVIGQLVMGMVISAVGFMGVEFMNEIKTEPTISFLAALGAALLLFSIGLESNLASMKNVGLNAVIVATIGVAVPFFLGTWVLGPVFFGDESSSARLFIGASLVATSIGITASVFRALGITRSRAAQTVLGAAVLDDVFGLVILAVVAAIASGGEASIRMVTELTLKAFGFLAIAIALGMLLANPVLKFFRSISSSEGMMVSVAVGIALLYGYLAQVFGLEPIIGAFAAGLVLEPAYFSDYDEPDIVSQMRGLDIPDESTQMQVSAIGFHARHSQIEHMIGTLNHVFVPVFFVYTGMLIDIESLLKPELYVVALIVTIAAVFGKIVAGVAAKGASKEKLLVGVAMVPRGEVGLIFAATGKGLGVLSDDLFSVIIIAIVLTTLIVPPLLRIMVKDPAELPV